ncbi:MAG: hypothetical protein ACRD6X_18140 [Pyrinomonadaceae bacterium]
MNLNIRSRVITIGIVIFFGLVGAFTANAQIAKQISSIRAEVNLINKNAPKNDNKTRNVEGISLEGAEATYYLSGKGLKKIAAKIYGETFRSTVELYYSGEEMIFAYQRIERYDTQIAVTPPPKVVKIIETRTYFSGGKAIRVIEGKKTIAPATIEYRDTAAAMNELSDKLKAAFDQ